MSCAVKCPQLNVDKMSAVLSFKHVLVSLNTDRVLLHLMAIDSECHSQGPILWKDRLPKLTSFVHNTSCRCCWDEHVLFHGIIN